MTLTFVNIVKVLKSTRSSKDQRKFVDATICSYIDESGVEYRKTFETPKGVQPRIFKESTHNELASIKYQF